MNLHRTTGTADWQAIQPARRSIVQKLAAATSGIVTPPNAITLIGLGLVVYGLSEIAVHNFWLGLSWLAVGRLLDIVDGAVAEATKTKSPVGEFFDAVADKIGTLLTIVTLIYAGVTYWWVIAALALPQVIIPLIIFYKKQKGIGVHPTRPGKLSMALAWVGIIGLLLARAVHSSQPLEATAYVIVGLSLMLGLYATWQYATGRD